MEMMMRSNRRHLIDEAPFSDGSSYWPPPYQRAIPKHLELAFPNFALSPTATGASASERDVLWLNGSPRNESPPTYEQSLALPNTNNKRRARHFTPIIKEKKQKLSFNLPAPLVPAPSAVLEDDESRLSRTMFAAFMQDDRTMTVMRKTILPHTLAYYSRAMFLSSVAHTLHDKHFAHLCTQMTDPTAVLTSASASALADELHFRLPDGRCFPRLQYSFEQSPDEAAEDDPVRVNVASLTITALHVEYYCLEGDSLNGLLDDDHRLDDAAFRILMKSITSVDLSVHVNKEFERLFGYSQQQIKNLYCRSGIKAIYRFYPPEEVQHLVRILVEGVLRRRSESLIETTILNKWSGPVRCILRTRILLDEQGFFQSSAYSWTALA